MSNAGSWGAIWQRKGDEVAARDTLSLRDLMDANGFDAPTGGISPADWLLRAQGICTALELTTRRTPATAHANVDANVDTEARAASDAAPRARVLEVGCGAGAMLAAIHQTMPFVALAGADAASSLVAIARRALPDTPLEVAAATALPFEAATFDGVFAHSVFAYFPSLDYAAAALHEMHRVARPSAHVYVLDVPDAATRQACESTRAALRGDAPDENPDGQRSHGPSHLYIPESWFADVAAALGRRVSFLRERVDSYPMSAFRYHALLSPSDSP